MMLYINLGFVYYEHTKQRNDTIMDQWAFVLGLYKCIFHGVIMVHFWCIVVMYCGVTAELSYTIDQYPHITFYKLHINPYNIINPK